MIETDDVDGVVSHPEHGSAIAQISPQSISSTGLLKISESGIC